MPDVYRGPASRIVVVAIVTLILLSFPLIAGPSARNLGVLALIYATVAMSWDVTLGYGGVFNFAHLAFFGIGAYVSGVLAVDFEVSPWLALVGGAVAAVIAAAVVYIPVSRLRGIYVALITFAFAQLTLRFVVGATEWTGGYLGLAGVPHLTIGDIKFGANSVAAFYLAALMATAALLFLRAFVRSQHGIAVVALRDDERYAVSRGVSVARSRLLAFLASAVFTGLAGGFYTFYLGIISPEVLGFSLVVLLLSMVLLGGLATLYGPLVAALVLTFATDYLTPLGAWRYVLISALVIAMMWIAPGGMWAFVRRGQAGIDASRRRKAVQSEPAEGT